MREVPDAALAGARRLELAGVGLDRGEQVLHRLVRRVGAHLHAGRVGVDQADRRVAMRRERRSGPARCIMPISTVIRPMV